ncbi:uncharacterized protein LOC110638527 [Hevea brasiliensis]|uniref:uncharacterized protein LOC110638527 n=1 Tax=Hevea brasiliensis TaxID=3981 RepID=UPI0025D4319E|nr:uncharacterized protein LOC110638527 [Hevea brasiliensis]
MSNLLEEIRNVTVANTFPNGEKKSCCEHYCTIGSWRFSLYIWHPIWCLSPVLLPLHLAVTSPLIYDSYNYGPDENEYLILLSEFLQSVALFGALLFFIGMKNLIPRRQIKKNSPKAKVG